MYCVKCGVELQKGAANCPLCGLRVWHPEIEEEPEAPGYPPRRGEEESVSRGGLLLIVSLLFALPLLICLPIDLRLNGSVGWSGVVGVSLTAAYAAVCLPLWFRRPNPVLFFPLDGAAALGLCLYLCLKSGGRWFLPFALPAGGGLILIVETAIVLLRYAVGKARHRALFVFGGVSAALGGLCVLIEFLLRLGFGVPMRWWSLYPLAALVLLGALLIAIGASPRLRRSLHKRLFL